MGTTWEIQVRVAKGIIVFNLIVIIVGAILLENWKPYYTESGEISPVKLRVVK